MNFYNDIDPLACAWTSELIKHGLIPDGLVTCKSIEDIQPHEIQNFSQCHFFNGISGWAEALRLADWPTERPVWCASLPCQSFSCAGKGEGFDDKRGQLWSPFLGLVRQLHPLTILGEQVPAAIGHGWLDRVFSDLEKEGYTCGAVVLGAHSVGAPQIRNRLYWVAVAKDADRRRGECGTEAGTGEDRERRRGFAGDDAVERVGNSRHSDDARATTERRETGGENNRAGEWLGEPNHERSQGHSGNGDDRNEPGRVGTQPTGSTAETGGASGMGNTSCDDESRTRKRDSIGGRNGKIGGSGDGSGRLGSPNRKQNVTPESGQPVSGEGLLRCDFWSDAHWHPCRDGKLRRIPVEPEIFPLAARIPGRVGLLRGAGNSICPETAALFIRAFLETEK